MFENPTLEPENGAEEGPEARFEDKLKSASRLDEIADAFQELAGGEERFESDTGFDMHVETTLQNIREGKVDSMYDSRLKEAVTRVLADQHENGGGTAESASFEDQLAAAETIDDIVAAMRSEAENDVFELDISKQKRPVAEVEQMIRGEGGYSQEMINDSRLQGAVRRVLEGGN